MKKFVWFAFFVFWGGFGVYKAHQYMQNLEPPTPQAQTIIDSLEAGEGWRLARDGSSCVVHDESNITAEHGMFIATVKAANKPIRTLSWKDRYWINKHIETVINLCRRDIASEEDKLDDEAMEKLTKPKKVKVKSAKEGGK